MIQPTRRSNVKRSKDEIDHCFGGYGLNPCFRGDMRLLTVEGYRAFADLKDTEPLIVNAEGTISRSKVWVSGVKDVYKVTLSNQQELYCTADHVFMLNDGTSAEIKACAGKQLLPYSHKPWHDPIDGATGLPDCPLPKLAETLISQAPKVCSVEYEETTEVYDFHEPEIHWGVVEGFVVHNCGEIIGKNFHCNLSEVHLIQVDPYAIETQVRAFQAGALSVAALLNQKFVEPFVQKSREIDPIVGVSFTGLFDFFVHLFGADWLKWWQADRIDAWGYELPIDRLADDFEELFAALDFYGVDFYPYLTLSHLNATNVFQGQWFRFIERCYLSLWKAVVRDQLYGYCEQHGLRVPVRYTTVQPAGTKSLLTASSPGWHPPKAQRFIRRITFQRNHSVCLAAMDYGYAVVPAQSCTDESGNLLNDPFDDRVNEWLLEIPVEVSWANLPNVDAIEVDKFSVIAQYDFYMQVQRYYTTHNTSATLELTASEIEDLGHLIYQSIQNDEGYISAALLARFYDYQSFPHLPFEPIDKATYDRLIAEVHDRRISDDFEALLAKHEAVAEANNINADDAQPEFACTSDKCEIDFTALSKPKTASDDGFLSDLRKAAQTK